jgi:hypothetical protein
MQTLPFVLTRGLHIFAGGVALASMWIPILAKKGGPWHRRGGWVYAGAMALVTVSGTGLAAAAVASGRPVRGAFLLFIALLSAANVWLGVRALARREGPAFRALDRFFPVALTVASAALGAFAIAVMSPLFGGFAVLGGILGVMQIRAWAAQGASRADRIAHHIRGMGGSCIATVTAFLVVNAGHMGFGGSIVPWFAPAIVGGVILGVVTRRYGTPRAAQHTGAWPG